jgi:UDP-3-O-[3-hydroxymyristoyl] N-acetylglucosamine deacetylase
MPSEHLALYAALSIPGTIAEQMMVGGVVAEAEVEQQIARARTFGLEREVRALLASGLALGGSLDNAVVLTDSGYLNAHVWPDEPCWHKVLDLLGDLALTGARISGQILAVRAGHRSHVALARCLRQELT